MKLNIFTCQDEIRLLKINANTIQDKQFYFKGYFIIMHNKINAYKQ